MKSFSAKSAILFCIILGFSLSAKTQENCNPLSQTSGLVLNLKLGMGVDEVSSGLGKALKIKTQSDDDYRFFQNYIGKKPPKNLEGVRAFYLRFIEKRLYQIEVFFEEKQYPSEIRRFAEIVSDGFGQPFINWKFANRQAVMKCGEIILKIDYQLNPRIELTNETMLLKAAEISKSTKTN